MIKDPKIGIIGCGMVGEIHIQNLVKLIPRDDIYLFDKSEKMMKLVSKRHGLYNICFNLTEILNNRSIDAVIICTPPSTHVELAEKCIKSSKNILIEKPIATKIEDLEKLEMLISKNSSLLIIDCSARHSILQPKFEFISSLINDGDLGEIYHIHHNVVFQRARPGVEYHPSARWFTDKNISGGGPFIDWGVYDLAFHLGMFKSNLNLLNFSSNFYNGFDKCSKKKTFTVEEHAIVNMNFENFSYYYERSSNCHNFNKNETRMYGSKAGLKFNYLFTEDNTVNIYRNTIDGISLCEKIKINDTGYEGYESDYFEMDKEFVSCLRSRYFPKLTIADSIRNLKILLKVYNKPITSF